MKQKLQLASQLQDQLADVRSDTVVSDFRQNNDTSAAVRLTAALVLRNLAAIPENRRLLRPHEGMLNSFFLDSIFMLLICLLSFMLKVSLIIIAIQVISLFALFSTLPFNSIAVSVSV